MGRSRLLRAHDHGGALYPAPERTTARAREPKAKEITVTVKSLSFSPKKVEVEVGESVVWTSEGADQALSDLG